MGLSSGSDIFNPVASALIDTYAPAHTIRAVLGTLLEKLRDADWDTYDESREEFRDNPVIAEVFARNLGHNLYGEGSGTLESRPKGGNAVWVLRCTTHGVLGTGDDTADEHDRLVRNWANHDQEEHGGDGIVDTDLLINREVNG
ncbi:hypothetical protein BDK92_7320 [Micromonospora pisi]|uniref:Uncharacterized protein n=1 Tax=Micromonospora pisi TaxID=589240 RepID=A0A495JW78_9ACTN|nr:hypothetical protein [Micromonospora pisi]RKR92838.1 hypothetical protein BDK92_7320 [Micromonospora pisi]